ncbi:MAG TPA: PaaI family thioesterase [Lachnospiraceae bacterium]|nr:PaaI family thioesterase [Lachnospiraceae bacterium]
MTDREILLQVIEENEYMRLLGLEMLQLEKGYGKGRMPYKKMLTNPYGMLHGGSLYSLADIVCGTVASMSGQYVTTVNGSMNFMQPAINTEYVYCEAKAVREGEHLVVFDVLIKADDGRILDNGSFTFFYTGRYVSQKE